MRRRDFMAGLACALPLPLQAGPVPRHMPLWPATPPGGGGPQGPRQVSHSGAVSNIAVPDLVVHVPPGATGRAMLVAAGGGYRHIALRHEAGAAVRWLTRQGIIAAVLTYRLPGEGWAAGPAAPLQDALRALRLIRSGRAGGQIDPDRIGLMGFSAGGHLAGLAATAPELGGYAPVDAADDQPVGTAALVLAYPVITLRPPHDRTATRRTLIGRHPAPGAAALWSVDTHVTAACPPVYMVQAADDPVADPANTRLMQAACRAAGVPVMRDLLAAGGHGFAMGRAQGPTRGWPDRLAPWLDQMLPA